jgi:hypothetical protein
VRALPHSERASEPNGALIDVIHQPHELGGWFGDYELLEAHHGYIQWLFPIREFGMNGRAQELQLHEARAIAADRVLKRRLRKSYELMLHFYGMKLKDAETGEIERGDDWRNRYRHLNSSFHNYLRITRILKCLGECGFEHYKWPFLLHVLTEIYVNGQLANCKRSCLQFWSQVLRRVDDQETMRAFVARHDPTALDRAPAPPPNPVARAAAAADDDDDDDDDDDADDAASEADDSEADSDDDTKDMGGGSKKRLSAVSDPDATVELGAEAATTTTKKKKVKRRVKVRKVKPNPVAQ